MLANLKQHKRKYPQRTWQDDVKWLYQAVLGCEHFVSDFKESYQRIKAECGQTHWLEAEILSDDFIRVNFSGLNDIEAMVLNRLFVESAKVSVHSLDTLKTVLKEYQAGCSRDEQMALETYMQSGCPAVHHSPVYRQAYKPCYRVICRAWWPYFSLLCQIEALGKGIVGIDGRCGSGKSTTGALLSRLYHCPLIHMDDFYLPLDMRTAERLSEPGGNVYYERFDQEVMRPIQNKEHLHYGIFDHRIMDVGTYRDEAISDLYIVEGSYAFHPTLESYYDLKIFMTIDKDYQRQRILKRNGIEGWKMFESRWIPLEEHYFSDRDFEKIADYIIEVHADQVICRKNSGI